MHLNTFGGRVLGARTREELPQFLQFMRMGHWSSIFAALKLDARRPPTLKTAPFSGVCVMGLRLDAAVYSSSIRSRRLYCDLNKRYVVYASSSLRIGRYFHYLLVA